MSFKCLTPNLAYQEYEGQKPKFLKITAERDYEFYLRYLPKKFKLLLLPCGKCPNCIKKKSQEWTSRLLKETENFKYAYFVTLTYNDENLRDLNKRDLQLFLKRYRKNFSLNLKYYITGEYGELYSRSHYHAILFQDKPIKDLKFYANNLYISKEFSQCWSLGNCLISKQVNERSIKYTIAYTLKKMGETKIILMSKGLGLDFFKKNKEAVKSHKGFYINNGYRQEMPYYFLRKLKESSKYEDIKYIEDLKKEPKPSVLVSGNTIGDLLEERQKIVLSKTLKGKGAF